VKSARVSVTGGESVGSPADKRARVMKSGGGRRLYIDSICRLGCCQGAFVFFTDSLTCKQFEAEF
jgi:hypothetical protein